jgi:hypothetical protein
LFTKIFGDHINAILAQQGIELGAIRPKSQIDFATDGNTALGRGRDDRFTDR